MTKIEHLVRLVMLQKYQSDIEGKSHRHQFAPWDTIYPVWACLHLGEITNGTSRDQVVHSSLETGELVTIDLDKPLPEGKVIIPPPRLGLF